MNPYTLGISKIDILFVLEILRVISFPIPLCPNMYLLELFSKNTHKHTTFSVTDSNQANNGKPSKSRNSVALTILVQLGVMYTFIRDSERDSRA